MFALTAQCAGLNCPAGGGVKNTQVGHAALDQLTGTGLQRAQSRPEHARGFAGEHRQCTPQAGTAVVTPFAGQPKPDQT